MIKLFSTILVLGLLWSGNAYAENKIFLKCKQRDSINPEGVDWVAVIDLDNMSFDMSQFDEGIPTNLRFGIVEVNDKIIIAKIFLKERYGDGYIKRLITVTIDRYLGSIDPSGLSNIVEDTRTDKYDIPFFFKQFWADKCEKFSPPVLKKKF